MYFLLKHNVVDQLVNIILGSLQFSAGNS